MSVKKPMPAVEILFSGGGVYPERIPLSLLAPTLSAVQRLAAGEAYEDVEEPDEEDEEKALRLLDVKRGSAVFRCVADSPEQARVRLREAGKIVANPKLIGEKDYVLRPIEILSDTARRLGCSIVIREPHKPNGVLARIEPASYELVSRQTLVSGDTSVMGTVERVGGATRVACGLRVPFQKRMLICSVATQQVARKLGDLLYQEVVVHGKAILFKNSWKIVSFEIRDAYQPQPGSLSDALDSIWKAGAKDWLKVDDPLTYLQDVRGE